MCLCVVAKVIRITGVFYHVLSHKTAFDSKRQVYTVRLMAVGTTEQNKSNKCMPDERYCMFLIIVCIKIKMIDLKTWVR